MMFKIIVFLLISLNCYSNQLFSPLPQKVENIDTKKVNLGEELFFDTILSKNQDVSCFSCHFQYGADTNQVSLGTNGQKGFINSPSLFNLQYHIAYFWNGRAMTLEEQMVGPISMKHEMQMDKSTVEKRLNTIEKYQKLFEEVYQNKPSFELVLDAIAEFEKTLITPNSKFDKYLKGELSLSKEEQKGFKLFNQYGCVACHNGINVGSNSFQKFGTVLDYPLYELKKDDRYTYTKENRDIGVYKVPSLRNVAKTAPYFHTGQVSNLQEAIRVMALYNLGRVIEQDEIESIESFLHTLTGELPKSYIKRSKGVE